MSYSQITFNKSSGNSYYTSLSKQVVDSNKNIKAGSDTFFKVFLTELINQINNVQQAQKNIENSFLV